MRAYGRLDMGDGLAFRARVAAGGIEGAAMRLIERRLEKLGQTASLAGEPRGRFRMVIGPLIGDLNLTNCTCQRTLCANGHLTGVVTLNGPSAELTNEELDRFVEGFPIARI
jgi:hypothetical protein